MRRRLHPILIIAAAVGTLAGCSDYQRQERPPWRAEAEQICLAKGLVTESDAIRAFHELSGPGICGATHPFKVTALDGGSVTLNSTQTLDCPMIAALDSWIREVVQPAAEARFGERVVKIDSMGSYNCRGINNVSGAGLSEHAFANAIDVGGFTLASGRTLNIMKGFNGPDQQERAFLHEAHAGACGHFTTVLGPGYNIFHYNHFHLDLAMHGATSHGPRRYCKPVPQTNLPEPPAKDAMPDPPAIEEEMDIARTPLPEPALRSGPPTLLASLPPRLPPAPDRSGPFSSRPLMAETAPAVPSRSRVDHHDPAEPAEAPLISFGGQDEEPPARPPRTMAFESPPATARPPRTFRPEPLSASQVAPDAGLDPMVGQGPRAAGSPKDWDLTSSIGR